MGKYYSLARMKICLRKIAKEEHGKGSGETRLKGCFLLVIL